ncbi:MAG: YihA family ribosome biogenesis GTP-binding protein [Clostridia bacterium]|nr:YihA family ribosome biogenesis GTP-binding protein [Clostridia bacterium]
MLNLQKTELMISAGKPEQFPKNSVPHVVFSGRSNVGKSSLINTLLNRKSLARVSSAPGKTVTVNFYLIDNALIFADLPGYGYARRSYDKKEDFSALTDAYLSRCENIALVLQLVDLKVGLTEYDKMMLKWLVDTGTPFCVIGTKADKLNKTELRKAVQALVGDSSVGAAPVIPFSYLNGAGKDEVWKQIYNVCRE